MKIFFYPNISWQIYLDTVYIFNEIDNSVVILNDSALDFWFSINTYKDFDEIITYLKDIYPNTRISDLRKDLKTFINDLVDNHLIVCG